MDQENEEQNNSNSETPDKQQDEEQEIPDSKEIKQENSSQNNIQQSQSQQSLIKTTPHRTPSRLSRSLIRPHENRQRLMVHKIDLVDFKSYAGVKTIGPFHKSFTSVVGPNGSGKSNLIESLLFVFGKRANWMRLKQLHQLIHNSGQQNTPKKASVEVHFHEIIDKEGDEYEIVEGSQFTVKRTVHMSNQTQYEINSSKMKQEDVINLLKSKGIDLNNNRFLILQGEVEQISLMKPKSGDPERPGLLEYLEDIIGSNQYKEKIEELDEQYEKGNERRREQGERMRITEQDLEKLNESKNIAVDYIRREKTIYQIQNVINQIFRYNAHKDQIRAEEATNEVQQKIKETKQQFKDKINENKALLEEWQKKRKELDEAKALKQKCKTEFAQLQEKDTKLRTDIKFETENQVKLDDKKDEADKEYSKILDDEKEMKKEIPGKEKQLEKLSTEKNEAEQELRKINNKIKSSNQKLVKEKTNIQNKLQPYTAKIKNCQSQQTVIQQKIQRIQGNEGNVEEQIQQYRNQIQQLPNDINDARQFIGTVKQAQQKMVEAKEKSYNDLRNTEQEIEQLQRRANEMQRKIDQNRAQANEFQQKSQLVSQLLDAQSKGILQGIQGRLGDLGAIDQQFDIAVTTACGGLDNIVVNCTQNGQDCIKYLREKRLGRGNFMPIDKLNADWYAKSQQQFRAPDGSQRLFDLIQIKKDEYRGVFYSALRDTLVCENLDIATKIAYGQQRYRVVTKDGKLVELTGTMSGGGRPKKGGMSNQIKADFSHDEVNEMKGQKQQMEERLRQLRQQQEECRRQTQEITKDETQARAALSDKEQEIEVNEQKVLDLRKKVDYLSSQTGQIEGLKRELDRLIKEQDNEQKLAGPLQQQLDELDAELEQQGGQELKEQDELVKAIKKRHDKLEKEVNEMRYKITNTEKNLKKIENHQKEVQNKLEKVGKKIENLKLEQNKIEEDAMNVLGALKAAEDNLQEQENIQKKNDEQKQELDQKITQMKTHLDKMNNELEQLRASLKKFQQDYVQFDKKLGQLRHDFKSIIEGYDFLQDFEELANFSTDPDQDEQLKQKQRGENEIDIEEDEENPVDKTMLSEQQNSQQQQNSQHKNKKRMSLGLDQRQFLQKDVTDDLSNEELEVACKYAENFNFKLRNEESKLQNLKSDTNIDTIIEFKKKYTDYKEKKADFEKVKKDMAETRIEIDKLKRSRFDEFMHGFNTISQKLKETYQNLTQGGDAELELIDSLDPFSDGVNFTVRPPKKSWKQINKLSGGEKTLSSLSLIFALHYYKPTPLYFMDEIDAALDFKNVSVVGHYVKERTKDAQFIIISLRNNMFELANKLVGVYKTFDQTKTIAIVPEKVQKALDAAMKDKEDKENNQDAINV